MGVEILAQKRLSEIARRKNNLEFISSAPLALCLTPCYPLVFGSGLVKNGAAFN